MYKAIIFLFITIAGCGTQKEPQDNEVVINEQVTVVRSYTIPLNTSKEIDDVTVHFKSVLEDSRCPKGATCVWEGRVRVAVDVTHQGTTNSSVVIFGKISAGEPSSKVIYDSADFKIIAKAVNPYPNDGDIVSELPYELVVETTP